LFDGKSGDSVFVTPRGFAGERIEIPTVPWAAQPTFSFFALLNRAFTERTSLMETRFIEGPVLAIVVGDVKGLRADGDRGHSSFRESIEFEDFVPNKIRGGVGHRRSGV
jgi:hypothetical protein